MTRTQKIAGRHGIELNCFEQLNDFEKHIEPAMIELAKQAYLHGLASGLQSDEPMISFHEWLNPPNEITEESI